MRQTFLRVLTVFLLTVSVFAQTVTTDKTLMGFSAENSAKQRQLETKFDSYLKAENLRQWMKKTFGATASRRFAV